MIHYTQTVMLVTVLLILKANAPKFTGFTRLVSSYSATLAEPKAIPQLVISDLVHYSCPSKSLVLAPIVSC